MAYHFVGFRDPAQFARVCRVFGRPEFVHARWDSRAAFGGEFDPDTDVRVFARGSD